MPLGDHHGRHFSDGISQHSRPRWSDRRGHLLARFALLAHTLAATRSPNSADYISPNYDDVLCEAAAHIEAAGSAGKADIAMLVTWKRIRVNKNWAVPLFSKTEAEVREVTGRAVAAARHPHVNITQKARECRSQLQELPGFGHGPALASALLCAALPDDFAVYDRRARKGLAAVDLALPGNPPDYGRYTELIEQCRSEARSLGQNWSGHEVDLALYTLGK